MKTAGVLRHFKFYDVFEANIRLYIFKHSCFAQSKLFEVSRNEHSRIWSLCKLYRYVIIFLNDNDLIPKYLRESLITVTKNSMFG